MKKLFAFFVASALVLTLACDDSARQDAGVADAVLGHDARIEDDAASGDAAAAGNDLGTAQGDAATAEAGTALDAAGPDAALADSGPPAFPCERFEHSKVIEGDCIIRNNTDLTGFSGTECIVGNLLVDAPELTDLSALESLQLVGGFLKILNTEATGLNLPELESVGELMSIWNNAALTSFSLPALASVGGFLWVFDNPALTTFGMPVLLSVGRGLIIGWYNQNDDTHLSNPVLTSFSLPALTVVGEGLSIESNPSLTGLGLPVLTELGGALSIIENGALANCEASNLRDQIQAADGIGGDISILNNANACEPDPCTSGTCSEECLVPPDYYLCQ